MFESCLRNYNILINKRLSGFFFLKPMNIFKNKRCSLFTFSCIVSIGTLLLYNLPFFNYVAENTNEVFWGKIFLLASLTVIMLALNFMMTYLVMFLTKTVGRILLALLAIINATAVYFIVTYSVMIDATTIENVFNTRYSEASGFFSWSLWLSVLVFGVHGLPMKLAPKVQYEIPFLVWTSEGFRTYKTNLPAVLEQHYIFHSVLNLLSIHSPAYNKDNDIFENR